MCHDLKCAPEYLVGWNGLQDLTLTSGQILTYYRALPTRPERKKYETLAALDSKSGLVKFPVGEMKTNHSPLMSSSNFSIIAPLNLIANPFRKIGKRKIYVVQEGESLKSIADKLDSLSLNELMNINNLRLSSRIFAGQHLVIK